jgi:branched-chain amino acid transport system permease protein
MVGLYYQNIFPTMGLSFGLKGFVAALLGGITSLPGAVAGGLLLGVFESLASGYVGAEYRDLVAFSLLLLLLVWRPQGILGKRQLAGLGGDQAAGGAMPTTSLLGEGAWKRQGRGKLRTWELHLSIKQMLWLFAVAGLFPLLPVSPYMLQVALTGIIFALLASGLTVVAGTAGQVSLGHAAFFGTGAYTAALLAKQTDLPFEVVLLTAGSLSAMVAYLSSKPILRLTGHAVSIATLAVGQIIYLLLLTWIPVTRGPMGIPGIPAPQLILIGGRTLFSLQAQYWIALTVLVATTWIGHQILSSPVGRTWRAIREDRLAAQAAGIPLQRYLPAAFGWGGWVAGLAGALYAYMLAFVSPDSFTSDSSILVLTMTVLGGLGNLAGAILGGLVLSILPEALRSFADYRMIAYGILLLLAVRFRPRGLAGID